ncbi:hypothetical protein [Pseudomonas aeruginosa]|uniref:hypothetical protein n=1 Tax=Pseudomonas aeruginosa TaxID=287 RepID=UPI0039F6CF7B
MGIITFLSFLLWFLPEIDGFFVFIDFLLYLAIFSLAIVFINMRIIAASGGALQAFASIGRKFDRIWCHGGSFPHLLHSFIYLKGWARVVCFLLLCLGAMLSLQKAALANIVIVLFFAYWLKLIKKTYLFFTFLLAGPGFICIFPLQTSGLAVWKPCIDSIVGLLTSDSSVSQDVPFFESIFDRVTALPLETLSFYGSEILVLGAGVFGGGGVLGYAQYPMAHNGICRAALHLWFHFWWLGCSFAIVAFCLLCIFACLPAKKNSLYRVRLLMLCIYNLVR